MTATRVMASWAEDLVLEVTCNAVTETLTAANSTARWPVAGGSDLFVQLATLVAAHSEVTSVSSVGLDGLGRVFITASPAITVTGGATLFAEALGYPTGHVSQTASRRCPLIWDAGFIPSEDSHPRETPIRGRRLSLLGVPSTTIWQDARRRRQLSWSLVPQDRAVPEHADSAGLVPWERTDLYGPSRGSPLRLYDAAGTLLGTYRYAEAATLERDQDGPTRWVVGLDLVADS